MSDRAQLYTYKGSCCAACGCRVEEMIARYGTFNRLFHFHHVDPTSKDRAYKRLMAQRLSRAQLDEIDKCVLLCVECHGILHAQNITAELKLSAQMDSRIVAQVVRGWVKADFRERELTFVTNEPYALHPCEVRVGKLQPTRLFLCEIEQENHLHQWLREIDQHRRIEIYSFQHRRVAMCIDHIEGRNLSVTQLIGFPLTQIDFYATNVPGEVIFFRNGVVLTKSGAVHTQGTVRYEMNLI